MTTEKPGEKKDIRSSNDVGEEQEIDKSRELTYEQIVGHKKGELPYHPQDRYGYFVNACEILWPHLHRVMTYSIPPEEISEAIEVIGKLLGKDKIETTAREASMQTCKVLSDRFRESKYVRMLRPENREKLAEAIENGFRE